MFRFSDSGKAGAAAAAAATSHAKRKKRLRKADTNVLNVKFNQLLQPGRCSSKSSVKYLGISLLLSLQARCMLVIRSIAQIAMPLLHI